MALARYLAPKVWKLSRAMMNPRRLLMRVVLAVAGCTSPAPQLDDAGQDPVTPSLAAFADADTDVVGAGRR